MSEPLCQVHSETKTLSERIAERVGREPSGSAASRNRSAFLALRDDIEQAARDGWSLLAIWKILHEEKRITFTYQAFRRYFRKLIDNAPSATRRKAPKVEASQLKQAPVLARPKAFTFNATPSKEQLL